MPYRVAFDMWGAATPLPSDGENHRQRIWPLNLWWALFVLSALFNTVAAAKYRDAGTLTDIQDELTQYILSDVLHALAAGAAAYFAVQLTAMQRRKAVHGPFGTGAPRSVQRLDEQPAD